MQNLIQSNLFKQWQTTENLERHNNGQIPKKIENLFFQWKIQLIGIFSPELENTMLKEIKLQQS